ncbi:MAG: cytochrome C oxidase subunit II [Gammaproteobacteria bacterium]|jgi:cytochrome c oxidase subunit 2|nr:cytochrome C oxidase subunit II [Gammaproteobacteria bacterium]
MHIDPLERTWVVVVGLLTAMMLGVIFYTAWSGDIHPPSNVEVIDSTRLHLTEEFAEDNLGARTQPDGSVRVAMVATRYGFYPQHIEVPVDTPITFRFATPDSLHGLHIPGTNVDTMVIPGFVSEVNTVLQNTGTFPMYCNEYCGLGHHDMWSRVTITPKQG